MKSNSTMHTGASRKCSTPLRVSLGHAGICRITAIEILLNLDWKGVIYVDELAITIYC